MEFSLQELSRQTEIGALKAGEYIKILLPMSLEIRAVEYDAMSLKVATKK